VDDPTLLAHWAFDETEGVVAYDSAGINDGTVIGVPTWQPSGGQADGALELDGTTFVVADFVLNPKEGVFSVFAWAKEGAPGQAIVSQQAGADWLLLDPATGALMTKALYSDAVIADGNWHRIGFSWDGSNRRLYVDDVLVAEDTDLGLADSSGGLNILTRQIQWGRRSRMAAGPFVVTRTASPPHCRCSRWPGPEILLYAALFTMYAMQTTNKVRSS